MIIENRLIIDQLRLKYRKIRRVIFTIIIEILTLIIYKKNKCVYEFVCF